MTISNTSESDTSFTCPHCGLDLEYFSGLEQIPSYLFCPECNDWAYDIETGERLFKLI